MTLTELVAARKSLLDRIGKADVTFNFNDPQNSGPTPGSIRDELKAFDISHPEVGPEMKRLRNSSYRKAS